MDRTLTRTHSRCMPNAICALLGALAALAAWPPAAARAGVVKAGAGSYLTTRPRHCKELPDTIYRTAEANGPVLTGQWWSSLIWRRHSQPLFAHPLALRCTKDGLTVGYPGSRITANRSGIFGVGGSDFTIGHSGAESFERADCGGHSDWFVTAVFGSGGASLRTTFGHGSPFLFGRVTGGKATIRFERAPQVWSTGGKGAVVAVTARGHHYGLFAPTGGTWTGQGGKTFTCEAKAKAKDYFSVALLPDAKPATLALFAKYAHHHVCDTRLTFAVAKGKVSATYRLTVEALEGGGTAGALTALYPHQWKYATSKLTDMTYGSVRGQMKVAAGVRFTTSVPVQGLLPLLPPEGIADRDRMLGYLRAGIGRRRRGYSDTYWEGKHLGKLATLSGIAEAAKATDLQKTFLAEIKRRLEEWFTAREGKDQPVFYYNAGWGTLIGSRPSYGSDRPLNDHHFHYGYFIRAAAEVARVDPAWGKKWAPMVELLIRDIASSDRADRMFPYLRCFDKYAGHSWASGDANFGDGNNQESSSESMNAWYGMALWGAVTGNKAMRDLGVALFNTERTAVEEYWFDVSGTNYPESFPNVALGMVWGGKGAFGTWFSGDIDCIHGINWLPFTPASLYMGRHPDYVKKNHDRIVSVRRGRDNYNNGWGDLVCMFGALEDPDRAAKYIDSVPNCKLEGGNTHAFMYHWIYTLKNLGRNDPDVTADWPLTAVFNKKGKRTHVAYNGGASPLKVTFSDGTVLTARPKGLTVLAGR